MLRTKARRAGPAGIGYLANRIFHTPLLIHPDKLEVILSVLGPRLGLDVLSAPKPTAGFFDDDESDEQDEDDLAPGKQDSGEEEEEEEEAADVKVIPVHGTLVKRSSWMDADSGLCSYASIERQMRAAMQDPKCIGVVLDIDSGGGESSGMFDLAEVLHSMRGQKPIVSISNDQAYSAGYCLASCADKSLVTSVGGVGSIGCWMLHVDQSKYDSEIGVKYTYIYAGAKKVDGNTHESLSADALKEWQQECDRVRMMFVQTVAKNRGVKAEDLYATEAGCYMGAASIPLLADGIGTLQDAVNLCRDMASGAASRSIVMPNMAEGGYLGETPQTLEPESEARTISNMFSVTQSYSLSGSFECNAQGTRSILALRKFGTAALAPSADAKQGRVSGVLAPYGSLSSDLGGFREIYQPGCFSEELKTGDERVLYNHNPDLLLGRKSAGTARFWEEPDGLHYEADLPNTQAGRDVRELMERGDIRESSAAFYILSHRWETRDGGRVRIIEKAKLVEGSPHSFAAYAGATAKLEPPPTAPQSSHLEPVEDYDLELLRARHEMLMLTT